MPPCLFSFVHVIYQIKGNALRSTTTLTVHNKDSPLETPRRQTRRLELTVRELERVQTNYARTRGTHGRTAKASGETPAVSNRSAKAAEPETVESGKR